MGGAGYCSMFKLVGRTIARRSLHFGGQSPVRLQAAGFRLKNLYQRTPHALHVAVDAKCICSEAV